MKTAQCPRAMRTLRAGGGALAALLATVLAVLAVVLGLTVVLLPFAAVLGFLAFRLYRIALRLLLPRPVDAQRAMKGQTRRGRRCVRHASRDFRRWRARARRRLARGLRTVLR